MSSRTSGVSVGAQAGRLSGQCPGLLLSAPPWHRWARVKSSQGKELEAAWWGGAEPCDSRLTLTCLARGFMVLTV